MRILERLKNRSLRRNIRGNALLGGTLAIFGVAFILIGLVFYVDKTLLYPTATAWVLLGVGTIAIGIYATALRHWIVLLAGIAVDLVAVALFMGHYAGYW
jgi:hypothetical protein